MDVYEAIRTRRSIHKYQDRPIPWDYMVTIIQAGKYAPCAGNYLNWKFIVIKNEGNRKAMAKACMNQEWMESAPIHVVVAAEPLKAERFYGTRGSRLYTVQGAAASIQNMMLAAHNLGIGSCWVGAFDEDEIFRICKMSEETSVQAVVTFGYPAEQPHMPPKHRIEHVTYFERWSARIESPKSYLGMWSLWNVKMVDAAKKLLDKGQKKVEDKVQEFKERKK